MILIDGTELKYVCFPDGTTDVDIGFDHPEIHTIEWHYKGDISEYFVCLSLLKRVRIYNFRFFFLPYARQDKYPGFGALSEFLYMFIICTTTRFFVYDIHNIDMLPDYWINEYTPFCIPFESSSLVVFPDENAYRKYNKYYSHCRTMFAVKERDAATGEIMNISLSSEIKGPVRKIYVVDDICDGGKTFIELAKILPKVDNLLLFTTYGIYSNGRTCLFNAGYTHLSCQYNILGN